MENKRSGRVRGGGKVEEKDENKVNLAKRRQGAALWSVRRERGRGRERETETEKRGNGRKRW